MGYRDVARSTDERTAIFVIRPNTAAVDKLPTVFILEPTPEAACLHANFSTFCVDFVARQKVGGTHLAQYIVEQFPVLPPELYTPALQRYIVPRVLELSYTAWDLAAFADDVWNEADGMLRQAIEQQWQSNAEATDGGHAGKTPPEWVEHSSVAKEHFPHPPFMWDEERRAQLRAELDGLYGHLYGLEREKLSYILDTFPIVKRKDEEKYGKYRTERLVLEAYDELADHFVNGEFRLLPLRLVEDGEATSERTKVKQTANIYFRRAVLGAEIVHQLHAEPTFGRVKFQKLLYLCEHHAGLDLDSTYRRKAAGPFDNNLMWSVTDQGKRQNWYEAERRQGGGTRYIPREEAGGHRRFYQRYYQGQTHERIQQVLDLLRGLDTERCEIVATLYAAWNDLLLDGEDPTDEQILHEVLENWHESKQAIEEDRWRGALQWMREKGIVPMGQGKRTVADSTP